MKRFIRGMLRRLGYEVRRTATHAPLEPATFLPYVREFSVNGRCMRFWVSNPDAEWWYTPELLEFAETRELIRFAIGCRRILEIGSHHGFTALLMSLSITAEDSLVVGVDAHPANTLVCDAQAGLNAAGSKMVFLNRAISDTAGKTITLADRHNAAVVESGCPGGITVETETVDGLNERFGPVDLLKVDVEGHEYEVLRGAKETLKTRPRIDLELHLDLLRGRMIDPFAVLNLIDLSAYVVKMEGRTDRRSLVDFEPGKLQGQSIVNLILEPKR